MTKLENLPARAAIAALLAGTALTVAACGHSAQSPVTSVPSASVSPQGTATSGQGNGARATSVSTAAHQVEVNPPGDIPDNQAFVPYVGAGFIVSVPEGWARTQQGAEVVVFTDKYNSVTVTTMANASAPTVASASRTDVPGIKAASQGFTPGTVTAVQRRAGTAILITYRALSAVNPVTGKVANEAIERYEFWRNGREVAVTLAAPVGSDNVDPWRKVTDSFTWSGA